MAIPDVVLPYTSAKEFRYELWFNPTDDNSLRLSFSGYKFVKVKLNLMSYDFDLDEPLSNRNLLQLERYFQGMYYLFKNTKLIVFDEQEATMLTLHSSDLKTYLDNLEINE
jgi:hypothetical protein